MSDAVQIALIATIPPTVVGVVTAYLSRRALIISKEVQVQTNGLNSKLLKLTGEEAHARGVKDEKERDKGV